MNQKPLSSTRSKNILLYLILFLFISNIVFIPLLLTPNTRRVFPLSDAEFENTLAVNRIYLYITEDSYQIKIEIYSAETDSLNSLNLSDTPIEITNSLDYFSTTAYKPYNFTMGNQSYLNELIRVHVYSSHKNSGSYPFDSHTIVISIKAFFILEGNYSSTLIVIGPYENSLSSNYISSQNNNHRFEISFKSTVFEQFTSLLIYMIALLYSLLLLIPDRYMSLQQKTIGTITILLAFFMIEDGISLAFSLLGIYQIYTILCLICLLSINFLIKGIDIDKSKISLLIIPLIFYSWFLSWNLWLAPRVYNWNIAYGQFGIIWSLFPLILGIWTLINWILFYKVRKASKIDLFYI